MRKIIFIVASLFVSASISAQTLATFEDGAGDILTVDAGSWHTASFFSHGTYQYWPTLTLLVLIRHAKCAGAVNVADAGWYGNFLALKLNSPITITNGNRILSFMAYRSIQTYDMRVGFNNNDGTALWQSKLDADATWQTLNLDLGLDHMGGSLSTIIFIISCNWSVQLRAMPQLIVSTILNCHLQQFLISR
jgi:hypothetical protein